MMLDPGEEKFLVQFENKADRVPVERLKPHLNGSCPVAQSSHFG